MMNNENEQGGRHGPGKKRKKKKVSPIGMFFRTVFSIVIVFCIVAGGAVFAYHQLMKEESPTAQNPSERPENNNSFLGSILGKGIKLNVAVFGVDGDGTRTDVMFVVHFDSNKKQLGLISLPRDTKVDMTKEVQQKLDEAGRYYQTPAKLNAVHAYSGKEMGCKNAVLQIEELLDIKIDHYVKVDLEGFRNIVDAIGGVEMDVPQNMKYSDPYQDLYINLKAGPQVLDGDKAEQLVRFRSYLEGDVARVQVQQLFLKAFAKKILSTETIMNNLSDMVSTLYNYVETDLTLIDALKYVRYVNDVDMNNITMDMLPGEGKYVGVVSYFIHDDNATRDVVDKVFFGAQPKEPAKEISSKDKKIEVANGGIIQGLAGRTADTLKEAGFHVVSITTYDGERKDYTRIIVSEEGMGGDLKKYFENSEIEINNSLLNHGTDIRIILGTNEK